jgi:hypothetical protein
MLITRPAQRAPGKLILCSFVLSLWPVTPVRRFPGHPWTPIIVSYCSICRGTSYVPLPSGSCSKVPLPLFITPSGRCQARRVYVQQPDRKNASTMHRPERDCIERIQRQSLWPRYSSGNRHSGRNVSAYCRKKAYLKVVESASGCCRSVGGTSCHGPGSSRPGSLAGVGKQMPRPGPPFASCRSLFS